MSEGARRGAPAPGDADARSGADAPRDALEAYATELFAREDPLLAELREEMARRGLPSIQVPARTGLFLRVLVAATAPRRVLEIGTLGGYSALWMAGALPEGGRITTLEKSARHVALAREFVERAGLEGVVEVRQGLAADLLPGLGPDGGFDIVFLDADKERYLLYLEHAKRLLRPGGLLLADNAFWHGRILEVDPEDPSTAALQAFNRALAESDDFLATIVPVGDGVAVGVRRHAGPV